jgi:ATP-dependent helicase/nuclease subunit A
MEVFTSVGERIEKTGGEAVILTTNFRSHATICNWCDKAFGSIFHEPELDDVQASYTDFDPDRPPGRDETGLRRIEIGNVYRNKAEDIAGRDARRIARFIRGAHAGVLGDALYGPPGDEKAVFAGGADYSDFLILTRKKKRLSSYAEAMAERGIPYTVTGSEDLGDSDELKAIVDLLTCALRPDDEVACVAYLKGGLVGASDDDLYRYKQAGGSFGQMQEPVPEAVLEDLSPDLKARFRGAFERLRRARALLRTERPSVALKTIVDELGLLAGAAHPAPASEGSLRAGYVLRTLTYVQDLTARGLSWAEITDELQRVIDGEEEIDGMTLETGSEDAVRIMNVHQAKGLEAPVVFLADPYSSGSGPGVKHHLRRDSGTLVAPIVQGEGYREHVTHPPLGWDDPAGNGDGFKAAEERHEEAEERRLLYVAATRAERLLVVSTHPERLIDGPWSPLYDHLDEADVPELTVPDADPPEQTTSAPAPDLESGKTDREQRLNAHSKSSYSITSISEEKPEAGPLSDDGYGAAFGTVLHLLLEQQVLYRVDPPTFSEAELKNMLESEGGEGTEEAAGRLRAMLNAFQESRIWEELQSASTVHTEYEFAHVPTGGESSDGKQEEIRRGTIDLLFKNGEEWTILDFKSDRIGPDVEDLDAALGDDHPYREQIRLYQEAVDDLIGEPVKRAALWFADVVVSIGVR